MSSLKILVGFKKQLVDFIDELIASFPNEPDFIMIRIFLKDQVPIEDIMKYFVETILPLENMVATKNDKFFLENNILFESLDSDSSTKVNYFKRLWTTIDKNDKDIIWKWFSSFIFLAKKYVDAIKSE